MRLAQALVINGCQTVTAIRDAYEGLDPTEQEDFRNQAFVQVKVITSAADYVENLIITTNDQNPMNPRNLKSNTAEQKDLQAQFRRFPGGCWFYERKDGEWKSLEQTSHRVRWFRKSDYSAGGRGKYRFRKIDNEELARSWYSWIGYSESVLKGGIDYFTDEAGIYARIFKSRPKESFWVEFSKNAYFSPSEENFEAGVPSTYEYLLACTMAQYVDARRVGWQRCKRDAIQRGVDCGDLKRLSFSGEIEGGEVAIGNFLNDDVEYRLNILLLNVRDTLLELFSFVLSHRYGALDAAQSRKLLQVPDINSFWVSAFSPDPDVADETQNGERILGPTYAFLRYCLKQYYFANKAEIAANLRLKTYFYSKKNVGKLREFILATDREIKDFDANWKLQGKSFIGGLPELG